MGTLNKYIFKQVAISSLLTVALFVFVLVIGNIVKETMGDFIAGRMSIELFLRILVLIIPGVIPYALPLGMLTGILLVFGRMSAQSEIIAIKACGRSIYSIAAPVFFLAIIASFFSLAINFYYAPAADYAYKSLIGNLVRSEPLQFIKPGTFIQNFNGFVLYANSAEGKQLKGFRIWELDDKGRAIVSIHADSGMIDYRKSDDVILLTLKDGTAERSLSSDPEDLRKPLPSARFEELSILLPLGEIFGNGNFDKPLKRMHVGELFEARKNWHPRPIGETTPELAFKDRIAVQVFIQRHFAMAFSIFSMVLLAIPLGIKASRTETFANLAIALALALSYYLLIMIMSWFEKYPSMRPDILVWIPNILFQVVGITLMYRSSKN